MNLGAIYVRHVCSGFWKRVFLLDYSDNTNSLPHVWHLDSKYRWIWACLAFLLIPHSLIVGFYQFESVRYSDNLCQFYSTPQNSGFLVGFLVLSVRLALAESRVRQARWVALSEGMQQWERWSFISPWKVYFSLVNRHGCISLSVTPPPFSPSFFLTFLRRGPLLSASYLELYRGQIEGIIFPALSFSAMQWYWRSHSAPVSEINQKHFSTAAINGQAFFLSYS